MTVIKIVFTSGEVGDGKAFLKQFDDEQRADDYAAQHGCIVMDGDDLALELISLRRWVASAADEFNTAQRKLRHARQMYDRLLSYELREAAVHDG